MPAVLGSRQRNGIPGQVRHTLGQHCPGHCSYEILTNVLEKEIHLRSKKNSRFRTGNYTLYCYRLVFTELGEGREGQCQGKVYFKKQYKIVVFREETTVHLTLLKIGTGD